MAFTSMHGALIRLTGSESVCFVVFFTSRSAGLREFLQHLTPIHGFFSLSTAR